MVRASRDGDQFHYLWAARRCVRLLSPSSGLVAITIEGASPAEFPNGGMVETGEEVIDVAEYHGSQNIGQATRVRYIQLKHSTLQANDPWAPSGLRATLAKFAQRYGEMQERLDSESIAGKLEFQFVSNRPISADLLQAIEDAAREVPPRRPSESKKLEEFTNLQGADLAGFCKLLRMEGGQAGYWAQRNLLFQDVGGYLPEADVNGPMQLKEIVTQKALSQNLSDPSITQKDVQPESARCPRSLSCGPTSTGRSTGQFDRNATSRRRTKMPRLQGRNAPHHSLYFTSGTGCMQNRRQARHIMTSAEQPCRVSACSPEPRSTCVFALPSFSKSSSAAPNSVRTKLPQRCHHPLSPVRDPHRLSRKLIQSQRPKSGSGDWTLPLPEGNGTKT